MRSPTFLLLLSLAMLVACRQATPEQAEADTPETPSATVDFQVKTFASDTSGIDSLVLQDRDVTLVAVPMEAAARRKPISDEEAECLKKCKKPDGSYDLNCILLCPVSKRFSVRVANVAVRQ